MASHYIALAVQRLPELGELVEVDALVAVLIRGVDEGSGLRIRHLTSDLEEKSNIFITMKTMMTMMTLEMRLVSSSAEMRPSPSASKSLKALERMREMLVNKFLLYFTSLSSVSLAPAIV